MPDGGVYALSLESGLGVGFAIPVQPIVRNGTLGLMHIAKAGEWKGHPTGPFEFDAKLFDALIARFEARGSSALLVDYSHKSTRDDASEDDIRAGGWIRSLWRKGDDADAELWAAVEFTAKASEMIAAGELLFCSPVVAWEIPDTRTGKAGPELLSAALTNQPFQDHLKAIALSRQVALAAPPPFKAKGDEEEAEGEEPPEEGQEPPAEGEPAEQQEEPPPSADGATPPAAEAEGPADPLMDIATELGIDRGTVVAVFQANQGVFAKAIGDALEKQRKDPSMATPPTQAPAPAQQVQPAKEPAKQAAMSADQRIAALEKQMADDRVANAKAVVLSRVDALIAQGHGTEDMRDFMVFEFSRDAEAAAKKFATKVVPVGETQAGNRDQVVHKGTVKELSDEERAIHDVWVKTRIYKSTEAVNRLLARRSNGAGKAA